MFTRRSFLNAALAFAATATLDPEKLLWIPGKKSFFIPKPEVFPAGCHVDILLTNISIQYDPFPFNPNAGFPIQRNRGTVIRTIADRGKLEIGDSVSFGDGGRVRNALWPDHAIGVVIGKGVDFSS